MAIKAILDSLDDAPEGLRDHYVPGTKEAGAEGKFVLGVEAVGGWTLEDVGGLKSALHKERGARESLERSTAAFKDLDPEIARAAIAKVAEFEQIDPTKEADKIANTKFEAAKNQLVAKHQTEITGRDERIQKLAGALDGLTRKQQATQAVAEAKGSVALLMPHVLAHTRVKETEAGEFVTEVVDGKGDVRFASNGEPMTINDLVAEMRASDTFSRAFDGAGHTGGGKVPDGGGSVKADLGGSRSERARHFAQKSGLPVN